MGEVGRVCFGSVEMTAGRLNEQFSVPIGYLVLMT